MNINSVLKLGFVGDIGLTKAVQSTIDKKGEEYIFSAVMNQLNDYDLLIGNFEGCVSPNWDTFNANNKLCLSPSFIEIFRHVKFDVFSLCNNHILDASTSKVHGPTSGTRRPMSDVAKSEEGMGCWRRQAPSRGIHIQRFGRGKVLQVMI